LAHSTGLRGSVPISFYPVRVVPPPVPDRGTRVACCIRCPVFLHAIRPSICPASSSAGWTGTNTAAQKPCRSATRRRPDRLKPSPQASLLCRPVATTIGFTERILLDAPPSAVLSLRHLLLLPVACAGRRGISCSQLTGRVSMKIIRHGIWPLLRESLSGMGLRPGTRPNQGTSPNESGHGVRGVGASDGSGIASYAIRLLHHDPQPMRRPS
jgi:hypothetical protein